MNFIYLDNSASTNVIKPVIERISECMLSNFANPSSSHSLGIKSKKIIENAKKYISDYINSHNNGNIFFTSGATEANNLAIFGSLRNKSLILTTSIEHASILKPINFLKEKNFEIKFLRLNPDGTVNIENFLNSCKSKSESIFVSVALVNNETGIIQPIEKISNIIKKNNDKIIFHVDAAQGLGKIPIDIYKMNVDLLSASAHKIHGPKGIGFLYVSKKLKLRPILYGGNQEMGIRAGTESVELISGFEEALKNCKIEMNYNYVKELNLYLRKKIKNLRNIVVNSPENSSPYIINFSVLGIKSEIMLNFLSSKGIYISAASACNKNKKSYVLSSFGLDDKIINSAIRVSFSKFNTKNEIDVLISEIQNAQEQIIHF
ncbi:MAG: cysteine desulfurase [Candidatus Improbicoccus pseudotrichonymphae]|uniref:cysteine desulfurase n=1 Tax=Candidatus Improbicoccus pseudotrichonymphae TaxID=3033792 RepID=A0AA48IB64_9FIRM|nr:MAG: cysteine desulfurase [Candidatus Improbicoccus pseudotrichonymphae]